jgi:hypothetical protein
MLNGVRRAHSSCLRSFAIRTRPHQLGRCANTACGRSIEPLQVEH